MSLVNDILTIGTEVARNLHGESVELFNANGDSSAEITDAIVSLDSAVMGDAGSEPADQNGVIRLAATHHAAAVAAQSVEYQGRRWYIGHVGDVKGGLFRVEIARNEARVGGNHTNLIDLHGNQIPFSE
jgi:hypothetical protein